MAVAQRRVAEEHLDAVPRLPGSRPRSAARKGGERLLEDVHAPGVDRPQPPAESCSLWRLPRTLAALGRRFLASSEVVLMRRTHGSSGSVIAGAQHPHFRKVLGELTDEEQAQRIQSALVTLH